MPSLLFSRRPSKNVERRMIIEACRHLERFAPLSSYSYVGMGGLEFIDFELFHRHLGIERMTSIEKEAEWTERYEFNKPFRTIEVLIGKASEHLPTLAWTGPHVVWLDYTSQLDREVIRDCETVVRNAEPGSVLLLTICAKAHFEDRLARLEANVGSDMLSETLEEKDFSGKWGFALGQWDVISRRLRHVAANRIQPLSLRQFVHFWYRDGLRMQTIGWILAPTVLEKSILESGIESLPFSRTADRGFEIDLPLLTRKELTFLNTRLPLASGESLDVEWIDPTTRTEYSKLYRWYSIPPMDSSTP